MWKEQLKLIKELKHSFDEELNTGVTPDLGAGRSEGSSLTTQLDILVERISNVYGQMKIMPVTKPWLPPLPDKLVSNHIQTDVDTAAFTEYDLSIPLGLVDIPENQEQTEFEHDFFKDGNLALFGASGYGKSVTMMSVSLELAVKNSPALVQFYVLDFGSSSLIQLKGLPHTADYITFDDAEKLQKFTALLTEEIALRKRLFARENAVSFKMYNQTAKVRLPAILIIDDVDSFIEKVKPSAKDMETLISSLADVGISIIATTLPSVGIRGRLTLVLWYSAESAQRL